jgi:hypothetical protein
MMLHAGSACLLVMAWMLWGTALMKSCACGCTLDWHSKVWQLAEICICAYGVLVSVTEAPDLVCGQRMRKGLHLVSALGGLAARMHICLQRVRRGAV